MRVRFPSALSGRGSTIESADRSSVPDDLIREAQERFGIIVIPGVIR